jgi:glutathione synthase/RimK-type ligase-like ATP-grasp enzyme
MNKNHHIAIGTDHNGWYEKFGKALNNKIAQGFAVDFKIINIEAHDWQTQIEPFDVIIWNPSYMGPKSAKFLREKITIIEKFMGKLVLPNWATVWHFESKIAQSYLFAHSHIKVPTTIVSFDRYDAMDQLQQSSMPIVWKLSHGASSKYVRLIRDRQKAKQQISKAFCEQLWNESKQHYDSRMSLIFHSILQSWFWEKVRRKIISSEKYNYVYWQEFIPNNPRDLRITVIGDRFAFGFWRNNRPNDFRASGSGLIDYQSNIPELVIRYCVNINRKHNFDSMCYDILFTPDNFVITEMSYTYVDSAIHNANGYYELNTDDTLFFRVGHTWPQTLWVEWALCRLNFQNRI